VNIPVSPAGWGFSPDKPQAGSAAKFGVFELLFVQEPDFCSRLERSRALSGALVGKKEPDLQSFSGFRTRFFLRIPFPPGLGPGLTPLF
jgi:hypothetical protein